MAVAIDRRVSILSWIVALAGVLMIVAGVATWFLVQGQLADQQITVADDADFLAGDDVNGPFSAYAQADVINKHALEIGGGKTYAELPQDDPNRETVMDASFLQASLYTSVVAFGVAAMAAGLGVVLVLIAWALHVIARTPVAAETATSP